MPGARYYIIPLAATLISPPPASPVCLHPRVDLTTADRGGFDQNLGYFGLVRIAGGAVARNRLGIFRLDPPRPVGDPFGYGRDWIALSEDGAAAATQDVYDDGVPGFVAALRRDAGSASLLARHQVVAHGIRDSIPEMQATIGGVALSGDGTLLATSIFGSDDVALFRVDADDATPGLYPQPVEMVPGARADTLLLSHSGDVLIAADDSCAIHSGPIPNINRDDSGGTARLRIYRRVPNGIRALEFEAYGSSVPCFNWGYPGISVSANREFDLVAVGSFHSQGDQSAVSVFEYHGPEWRLRDTIGDVGSNKHLFVSLSGDGDWLAVGNPLWMVRGRWSNTNFTDGSRITLKHFDGSTWETKAAIPGNEDNFRFGNGIAIDSDATIVAAGHGGTPSVRVYDIADDCRDAEVPVYPHPDTSACEDGAITLNSTSPVFHLALSGNVLAFEDSVGFEGRDASVIRFYGIRDGWEAVQMQTENFTRRQHQDVVLAANGTIAAVLAPGITDGDPDVVRVFRLGNGVDGMGSDAGVRKRARAANGLGREGTRWAQELTSIVGGKFDASMRGITFNRDGDVIAVGGYTSDEQGRPQNFTVRAYKLEDDDWSAMGRSISAASAIGQCSLSRSGRVLAVGDAWFGEERQGRVRVFKFRDGEWAPEAEFVGKTDPNRSRHDHQEDENLGYATSLDDDGALLAVGVYRGRDMYGTPEVGAVNVYRNTNGTWALRERFSAGERYDAFGCSLALSGDGRRIAVGSCAPGYRSRVRLYEYDDAIGQWLMLFSDKGYTATDDGEGGYDVKRHAFGQSVALNEEGSLLATGSAAPGGYYTVPGSNQVRLYNLSACIPPGTPATGATAGPSPRPSEQPGLLSSGEPIFVAGNAHADGSSSMPSSAPPVPTEPTNLSADTSEMVDQPVTLPGISQSAGPLSKPSRRPSLLSSDKPSFVASNPLAYVPNYMPSSAPHVSTEPTNLATDTSAAMDQPATTESSSSAISRSVHCVMLVLPVSFIL